MKTVNQLISWGVSHYTEHRVHVGHGTENPEDDILFLCLSFLNWDYSSDASVLDQILTDEQMAGLQALILRRVHERIPAAYLMNKAYFCGLEFYVDPRVLIPRSPIAELIEAYFTPWIDPARVTHILDLCTGSGCIAIACAYAFPDAVIHASDLSPDALTVAKLNAQHHQKTVCFYQSNVLDEIPVQQYDIIVSNPPYVSHTEMSVLPVEYQHEPTMGFFADEEGLSIVLKIVHDAKRFLKPGGILIVEVGCAETALIQRLPHLPFIWLEFQYGGSGVFLLYEQDL